MYKELLVKNEEGIFLDKIKVDINEEVEPIYLDLIVSKLKKEHYDFKRVKQETITPNYTSYSDTIMVDTNRFEFLRKNVFLFTEVACTTNLINNVNVTDFKDVNAAIDYSLKIYLEDKEYHLIKKNNYAGYSVHRTFTECDNNELEANYVKKYIK